MAYPGSEDPIRDEEPDRCIPLDSGIVLGWCEMCQMVHSAEDYFDPDELYAL